MADPTTREADRIRSYFGEFSSRRGRGSGLLVEERRRLVEQLVEQTLPPLAEITVCDVGCGAGSDLRHWRSLGVPEDGLFGTELLSTRADAAREALPRSTIAEVDGFEIPFPDGSFDLVSASLVLSSVRDAANRRQLTAEMWRVTRGGGALVIYDFRVKKPWNSNVVAMRGSELAATLGPPAAEHRLAPFLPLLDLALRLPRFPRGAIVRLLPRTHRLWVWARPA